MKVLAATHQGRFVGVSNRFAKFTEEQVSRIRMLRAQRRTLESIAKEIGCSLSYAGKVCKGDLRKKHPVQVLKVAGHEDLPVFTELLLQGLGYESIAKKLDCTRSSSRLMVIEAKRHLGVL